MRCPASVKVPEVTTSGPEREVPWLHHRRRCRALGFGYEFFGTIAVQEMTAMPTWDSLLALSGSQA